MINILIIIVLSFLFGVHVGIDASDSVWKKRIDDLMEERNREDQEF